MNEEQQPAATSATTQPPTSHKKRNILIGLFCIVIILALGIGIGYVLFGNSTSDQAQTVQSNNSPEQKQPQLQPEAITTKIKSTYAAKYKLLNTDENNQPKSGEMSIKLSKTAPLYKTEGYDFYTDYDGGSTLVLIAGPATSATDQLPRAVDTAIRNEVAGIYTSYGLTKQATRGDTSTGNTEDVYAGKGLICTIETPSAPTSLTTASCGLVTAYKDAAAKIKPFAELLPNVTSSTALSGLKISDSQVSGYQKATLSQSDIAGGGSIATFYKRDSGAWTYFTNTQQALSCSKYNTTDLKSAFKGETCYLENGDKSMVQ